MPFSNAAYFCWDDGQVHWVFGGTLLLSYVAPRSASVLDTGAWVRYSEVASVIHTGLLLALTSCQVLALQVGARLAVLSLFCSFERVLQHNYGWLQNCCVAQASLKLGST